MKTELNPYKYLNLICKKENIKIRDFLAEEGISTRLIRRSIRQGEILLNGKFIKENKILEKGDIVSLMFSDEEYNAVPETGKFKIIFEDDDLLVVEKEKGQVVHNTSGHLSGTLSNYITGYFKEKGIKRKVRLVNRLDRDTTGLLIIAKNSFVHQQLADQMENNLVIKKYKTLCKGNFEKSTDVIELPIAKSEDGIKRVVDFQAGQYAKSEYKVLEDYGDVALVEVRIYTGRTHQIRVHMSHIGHAIVGDSLYGGLELLDRQALHSYYLEINHPRNKERISFETDIPKDFYEVLNKLGQG